MSHVVCEFKLWFCLNLLTNWVNSYGKHHCRVDVFLAHLFDREMWFPISVIICIFNHPHVWHERLQWFSSHCASRATLCWTRLCAPLHSETFKGPRVTTHCRFQDVPDRTAAIWCSWNIHTRLKRTVEPASRNPWEWGGNPTRRFEHRRESEALIKGPSGIQPSVNGDYKRQKPCFGGGGIVLFHLNRREVFGGIWVEIFSMFCRAQMGHKSTTIWHDDKPFHVH